MTKLSVRVQTLSELLEDLQKNPGFNNAIKTVQQIISILGVDGDMKPKLFSVAKIKQYSGWFQMASGFADKRACYKIADGNNCNIEFRVYWVKNTSKRTLSTSVMFTPNFEDEPFNRNKNIGIDFFIPEKADRVIVVLSNDYILRAVELHGKLTATYQEIFDRWTQKFDFEKKREIHNELWESFNLKTLNEKFYRSIAEYFTELTQYLVKHKVHDEKSAGLFTNRLFGRIIFCWFLRKKELIAERFSYFDVTQKQDSTGFYRQKLEKLFFGTLNTPIDERKNNLDKDTPFLNGGLFESQKSDLYGDQKLSFPKDFFHRLFATLESYNFTTDESTSDFQQVAIDPEMLGRIFENLLAEQTEETGEQARKAKGAYYTPREIVDYMCKESLREYLKGKLPDDGWREQTLEILLDKPDHQFDPTNHRRDMKPHTNAIREALDEIKVIDPAVGSGAFPMGMLQLMTRIYDRIDSRFNAYNTKLQAIKENLHGVDIEPMAVEICRLRAWLSLMVDEEVNANAENRGVAPLPNLNFKFVCANSLISAPEKVQIGTLLEDPFFKKLEAKIEDFFSSTNDKQIKRKEIEELINKKVGENRTKAKNFEASLSSRYKHLLKKKNEKQISRSNQIIDLWDSYKNIFTNDKPVGFFEPKYFFPSVRAGFDIIIANPPYVKEYVHRSAFDGLRSSPYYQGKMDLWYLFACKGIDLAKDASGIITFIAQNNWVTSYGASKMRNKVLADTQILSLIDFGDFKIFVASIQTMVMMFKKNIDIDNYAFDYRRLLGNTLEIEDVITVLNKEKSDKVEYLTAKISRNALRDKLLTFSNSGAGSILEKISKKANFYLDPRKEVAQGIVAPQDYVNKASQEILGGNSKVGDGIFVLSDDEVKTLKFSKKDLSLVKPFYTTDELKKWYGAPEIKGWIIYTNSDFKDKKKIGEYPGIQTHLDRYKNVITSDNKPYGLHRARDAYFFTGEKIIALRKCAKPTFTYTDFDSYVSATFYVIKTERVDQKYLVAILNSKLIAFWLRHKGKMQGNNYQIDKEPIIDLPIYEAPKGKREDLINLVVRIIKFIKSPDYFGSPEKQAKVRDIERQIDELVYKLYGLAPEEIKVVKGL